MDGFDGGSSGKGKNVVRIAAASIAALTAAVLLFGGRFLGPFMGDSRGDGRGDRATARTLRRWPRNEARRNLRARRRQKVPGKGVSLADLMDPKTLSLREAVPLAAEAGETLVRCEGFLNNFWPSLEGSVPIPEFWADDGCFHNLARTVVFFHVGKGGGGTIERELKLSRIGTSVSHPGPNQMQVKKLRRGPLTTLILNVRDPVDRYVSAFRWGLGIRSKLSPDYLRIETEEWPLLAEKYKADPNVLAEALCEDSPLYWEAEEDFSRMSFMGHKRPLADWIGFLVDPDESFSGAGIQHLIALPMERQAGTESSFFGHHIQQLALHLLQRRFDPETANEILMQRPEDTDLSAKARHEHSTGTDQFPALTPVGECCMARRLRGDYELIRTMLGDASGIGISETILEPLPYAHPAVLGACSWGDEQQQGLCRSDLRSMLSRRARYLDLSLGTCHNVVSMAGML